MKQSAWRILAVGALLGAAALPASAQVVIGGTGNPSVEVNWSVLDGLGRQPNLPDMLRAEGSVAASRTAANQPTSKAVQYRPYKAGATPYAKSPAKAAVAAKPKKTSVVPASAKAGHMAELVQSAQKTEPVEAKPVAEAKPAKPELTPVAETAKPAAPAAIGPQIALPELPKPATPVAATAPVQLAKAETAPAPTAQPVPPPALTPPPVAKADPTPQVASLPPTPAPAPAPASSFKGDTLSLVFASESARLPDGAAADLDRLAKRMQKDDGLALQLLAYAEGDEANASKARRLSLSRALEVRKHLMEQGLRSTRIEVRALGNKVEGQGPADRVDAVLVGH